MYEQYFGLNGAPFLLNPDPSFYFDSRGHSSALSYLKFGLYQAEGFIVITGDIGAGKTTLVRTLLSDIDHEKVVAAQLVSTQLEAGDLLRSALTAFGVPVKGQTKAELIASLEAYLTLLATQNKRAVLIVDEAQNLSRDAIEELRMLSNFQFGNQALMQSFLVGQPEFREILQRPEMEQFRQRVAATCHIGPLDQEETQHYIEHRLKCAGATGKPSFDPAVFEVIYQASGGIPRRINSIADRLLLAGFLAGKTHLEKSDIDEVVKEFEQEAAVPPRKPVVADSQVGELAATGPSTVSGVDVDLDKLQLDPAAAGVMSRQLNRLAAEQRGDQIQRLERGLLRLERTNLQILAMLQQLVSAVKKPTDEGPK